jgi:hypothetical protein
MQEIEQKLVLLNLYSVSLRLFLMHLIDSCNPIDNGKFTVTYFCMCFPGVDGGWI